MKKISKFFLLLILLMAGVGQTAKAADVVSDGNAYLYVKLNAVSWWLNGGTDGDHCFVYFYKGSSNQWSAHAIKIDNDHYAFKIPKGTWSTCILTRNNTTSSPTWNNKWNQTGDIALKSDKNYIKSFAESSTSATWDTYQQTSTASSTPSETTIDAGETVTFTSALTSNETYNVVTSTSYEVTPGTLGTDWTIDADNNQVTFLTANTYTVTATVTYNTKGFTGITKTATATSNQITVNAATSTHSITYKANGGTGDDVVDDNEGAGYAQDASVTLKPANTFSREGYTFVGWNDGTNDYAAGVSYTMPNKNVTMSAQWIERTITLQKSDYNGLKQAITLTASNPTGFTPTSYTFYYSKDEGEYVAIAEASASATATYTPTAAGSYTFKVIASDGTYNVEATTAAVTCNIPAYLVYATGSADWNAKATASEAVNDIISVTIEGANLRYSSASGQTGYCFFAFRIDDATGWKPANCFGSTKTNADEEVATTGTATSTKLNPTKGLYIKPGTEKADYTFTFSFNITNAQVSVTKTHKPVTVTYDANSATEGTIPVDETQYEVNTTVTVKENSGNLARTGYTYDGWNTKNDGTGTSYSAVDPLGQFTITANTTLYAKWNPITYNITYNVPEGASKGDNPDTYTIETAKITLKDASMTGKVFDGWFSEPEFTNQVSEIAKGSIGDKTLYAKFHDTQTYRLYYSNPDGWAKVYAYLWKEGGTKNKNWPGEEITSQKEVINNRTFYYYEFDETNDWNEIIFNNGASSSTLQTGDISFSVPANNNQYNNAKAGKTSEWQNLPEPIDPETPYTTVKVLCDYSSNVKIFFLNKSENFMVKDAEEDGNTSEYPMNAVGEGKQTIDGSEGYLYEVSFYGTSKMAIFVDASHIGDKNKLTANDVDLTKAARVTYYYDLTGVTAGNPQSDTFSKIWVPLTQGYGTFCYPQPVQVSQAAPFWMQIQENQDETSGYELLMTAMEDNILPANTGALIYSKQQNAQAILTVVESSATYEDNDFLGTTTRTAMPTDTATNGKVYVLGNGKDGIAFYDYQPTSGYIPAYKAYFRLTPTAEEPQGAPSRVKMTFRTEPATPTSLEPTKSTINNQQSTINNHKQRSTNHHP